MTDRFSSLTVVLKEDVREDDAEELINAIRQFKGVVTVRGSVLPDVDVAYERARAELVDKLIVVLFSKR